jgi:hypothetical protein
MPVVELTMTKTGLKVCSELDTRTYPKGIKVSDAEMASLNIKGDAFHPEGILTHADAACLLGNLRGRLHGAIKCSRGKALPSVDPRLRGGRLLRMMISPDASSAQNNIVPVSADGNTVPVLIPRLKPRQNNYPARKSKSQPLSACVTRSA